jgi:phosphate transport system permease protein
MSELPNTLQPAGGGAAALSRISLQGGVLPAWAPYGVIGGSAVALGAILAAAGIFNVAALLVLNTIVSSALLFAWSRSVEGSRQARNRLMTSAIVSAFAVAVLPLISLLYEVIGRGLARFDTAFFTETARGVVGEGGGALHAVAGTLIITALATLISVPIGLMAAIYLNEYGGESRLRRWLIFFVDVMTGIPSIVAGLFAFALFAIFLGPGIRLGIIGAIALAVLMIPIVIRSAEEILKIVPGHLREAAYALGTPKWKTIVRIVLPTALAGLVTGVMIAVSRVIGETAPLLVTTGVVDSLNTNPFSGRMMNLAVYAFQEYKNPGVMKEAAFDRAWAAALTLIAIVMLLNLVARFIYRRYGTDLRNQ